MAEKVVILQSIQEPVSRLVVYIHVWSHRKSSDDMMSDLHKRCRRKVRATQSILLLNGKSSVRVN